MTELTLLTEYGYLIVLVWVFVDQAGLPIPAIPVLFAAGVLAGSGSLNIVLVCAIAIFAAMASDLSWYVICRRKGLPVLQFLCNLSLAPDFCVRQAGATFPRYGGITLFASNFIPGLQTVVPTLAGVVGVPFATFAALRLAGTLLWVLTFVLPGFFLADQVVAWMDQSAEIATTFGITIAVALVAFATYNFFRRQWFLRAVRVGGVHPRTLRDELESDAKPHVVDLRSRCELEAFPQVIPGAAVIPFEEIDDHIETLRQKRDLILDCT